MEIPQGNTLENSGKQNPKMGFKSPPSRGRNQACSNFADFLIDFGAKIGIPVLMPRKLTIGKTSKIVIGRQKPGDRLSGIISTKRRNPSLATLTDAEALQKQNCAQLQRHREGRFNLDDREMLSQARDLASSHGYTVLQAIQEWHSSKGSSNGMPLGEVIEKFVAAKSNRSAAYMDKLNADMRLFQSHFGADRAIDRIRSDEIEDFLDSKKAASRRRNNLRSEIITLFRYAQIRLRALHRDRKTEAELVLRDQTKRKPVETFSPNEFQTFLRVVRPVWLPWLALGGLAGIRTDGEIFRITWECFKWDRRIIDYPRP